jgi:hypothetical protein
MMYPGKGRWRYYLPGESISAKQGEWLKAMGRMPGMAIRAPEKRPTNTVLGPLLAMSDKFVLCEDAVGRLAGDDTCHQKMLCCFGAPNKTHGVRYLDILYTVLTGDMVLRERSVKHLKRLSGTKVAWGLFSDSEVLTIFC